MRRMLCSLAFLCLIAQPLRAQDEALLGTWKGSFLDEGGNEATTSLTFQEGGVFKLEQEIAVGEGFSSVIESAQMSVEKITTKGTGTYRADGDTLDVEVPEFEVLADGRPFIEVLIEVARALAAITAGLLGVSEEDYPAFEENWVAEFIAGFDEQEFIASFTDEVAYAIEGDTLRITTTQSGVEEILEFQRVAGATSVTRTTWGDLKASFGD